MFSLQKFWQDESGAILSAELVTVGTVAVLGTTVGLSTAATALNEELTDFAKAIRSLDQSYSFCGYSSCRASTAGSCFAQAPVEKSLLTLCAGAQPLPVQSSPAGIPEAPLVTPETVAPANGLVTPAEEKLPAAPGTNRNPD